MLDTAQAENRRKPRRDRDASRPAALAAWAIKVGFISLAMVFCPGGRAELNAEQSLLKIPGGVARVN
jgi:hypothetical protein